MADAQTLGRHCGGRFVCLALFGFVDRLVLGLYRLWRCARDRWLVLRHQACCHRHRGASSASHWVARFAKQGVVGHRRSVFCGNLCLGRAVSFDRGYSGLGGVCRG